MPLTEKGRKIKSALTRQYGHEKGRSVFYAMKNMGKITGVDSRDDDFQHMGFSSGEATPIEKLIVGMDALTTRIDAFQQQQHQRKPVDVKPRTKDNMQPSMPHPKEVG